MDDTTLPPKTTPRPITGRALHASKSGGKAEWWDDGKQRTHDVAWTPAIRAKTLTVGGKTVTVEQILAGMAALEAAMEQAAEGAGPLVEVTP